MPRDVTTAVLRNLDLGGGNYLVEFADPEMAAEMQAGQFLMLGIPGSETLLRRPYSVCGLPGTFADAPRDALQLLYRVVGRGTALLAALRPGAELRVLGPLGRGFTPASADVRHVLVAGGIGIAPFPAWIAALAPEKPILLYGARCAAELTLLDWFRERTSELVLTTDDGSAGRGGFVTEPLDELLRATPKQRLRLSACGPEPMLRAVARLAARHEVECELALEAHMACGFGVCLGCVVPVRRGAGPPAYERVCVEGPVMRAERLAW